TIQPQSMHLSQEIHTLNDAQKLLGTINWICPYLGLTNTQLSPLLLILRGDPELTSG
ncbi:POK6 protein, partial [Callaeas wilsoni]|nr:POK6 protein [Callaeas wilsoni]